MAPASSAIFWSPERLGGAISTLSPAAFFSIRMCDMPGTTNRKRSPVPFS